MSCRVSRSRIAGEVACPPSKSYTHRAVFLASLAGGSTVRGALLSADTLATVGACRAMGADVETDGPTVRTGAPIGEGEGPREIDAANSGTTIRIAAGIAALSGCATTLTGDASLRGRPMRPLLDALSAMGAECSSDDGRPPVAVRGPMAGGSVSVPGGVSSQFVSSLLVCAPLTERGLDLSITGGAVSRPYIDATVAAMKKFGVVVRTAVPHAGYEVAPQAYGPADFDVPADYSSMALLLAAAALCGDGVTVRGGTGGLPQGDEAFAGIMERMGARVTAGAGAVSVGAAGGLGGGRFDLGDSPDLLPPLAVLALGASEPVEITGVGHARHKETDRIAALCRELRKLGARVDEAPGGMTVGPGGRLEGAALDAGGDHRLFMALCIAGMYVGGCTVSGADSVGVSYPGFVGDMRKLGAGIGPA